MLCFVNVCVCVFCFLFLILCVCLFCFDLIHFLPFDNFAQKALKKSLFGQNGHTIYKLKLQLVTQYTNHRKKA